MRCAAVAIFLFAGCDPVDTDDDCTPEARVSPCDVDKHGPDYCLLTSHCRPEAEPQ